ncbi:SRPBCC domain-containing protein [Candidatus Woesebacteria bacterium]|nr:SRPBCC domain-containing protein [Candidatus Woesebacteria bacterium]
MKNTELITVSVIVNAPLEKVWDAFTKPEHITHWAFASDDWEAPSAKNDLRVGGKFSTVMAAKDGSTQFDFNGVYSSVKHHESYEYTMEGGRYVKVSLEKVENGIKVTEDFEPETENSRELQQQGWQAILGNFKKYVESII